MSSADVGVDTVRALPFPWPFTGFAGPHAGCASGGRLVDEFCQKGKTGWVPSQGLLVPGVRASNLARVMLRRTHRALRVAGSVHGGLAKHGGV